MPKRRAQAQNYASSSTQHSPHTTPLHRLNAIGIPVYVDFVIEHFMRREMASIARENETLKSKVNVIIGSASAGAAHPHTGPLTRSKDKDFKEVTVEHNKENVPFVFWIPVVVEHLACFE